MRLPPSKISLLVTAALLAFGCALGSSSDDAVVTYVLPTEDSGLGANAGAGGSANAGGSGSGGTQDNDAGTSSGGSGSVGAAGEAAGGSGSGGSSGAGTGGTGSTGSGGGSGGSGSSCGVGQKRCGGLCVAPKPELGCSFQGCDACPTPPSFGSNICVGETCDFECFTGYVKSGAACVAAGGGTGGSGGSGSGGTSGTGGAGGGGMQCFHCSGTCAGLNSDSVCFVDCVGNKGRPGCIWAAPTCTCL